MWWFLSLTIFHTWVTMVRKKWLSLYYSIYWCYIHQTCTSYSSWHGLMMPHGGMCPWPTFHAWVIMVRKKWLSLYYNAYECYIYQTCTNCSSWHDLLMPRGGLCPSPIFHVSVTKTQNGNSGAPVMAPITIMSNYLYFETKLVQIKCKLVKIWTKKQKGWFVIHLLKSYSIMKKYLEMTLLQGIFHLFLHKILPIQCGTKEVKF